MTDPADVWRLILRADELVKYASNRDPAAALEQALAALDEAAALNAGLGDEKQRAHFERQIALRREDVSRYSSG